MDTNAFVAPTYNKIAKKYADLYFDDLTDTPFIDKFLSYLPHGSKILDVGCGNGNLTKYMVDKGYACEGTDVSQEMLHIAKERVPGITFTLQDMRQLDYANESFDGLLVAYSLIHIPSDQIVQTLTELKRILKPQGVLLFITQKGKPDRIVNEQLQKGTKIFMNFFTKDRLRDFLENAGLEIMYQEEQASKDTHSFSNTIIYTIAQK